MPGLTGFWPFRELRADPATSGALARPARAAGPESAIEGLEAAPTITWPRSGPRADRARAWRT
jgi:hypothetical protein